MTAPATAALRFGYGLLTGAALGLCHGFLRPLRAKHPHISDFLFVCAAFYLWLFLSFRLCRADIRMAYSLAMGTGCLLWEASFGRLLRPLFSLFWVFLKKIRDILLLPFKKTSKIAKILFASVKKWVTIKWNSHTHHLSKTGGKNHVKTGKIHQQVQAGQSAQPEADGHRAGCCHLIRYGYPDPAASVD